MPFSGIETVCVEDKLMPFAQGYQKVPTRTRNGGGNSPSSSRSTISDGDVIGAHNEEQKSIMTGGHTSGSLPTTYSSQQLMGGDAESVTASLDTGSTIDGQCGPDGRPNSRNSRQYDGLSTIAYSEWFTVIVLCFVNLINYMDRFTIAGKLMFNLFIYLFLKYQLRNAGFQYIDIWYIYMQCRTQIVKHNSYVIMSTAVLNIK